MPGMTYKKAGVDIDAANKAVSIFKKYVKQTQNKNVVAGVGSFGGMFNFEKNKFKNPILVSSTDGVGTKLKLAHWTNKHDTVGQDLVNHCVNDILVQGAMPLFYMDYVSVGKLYPKVVADIVKGFALACRRNNCALLGGETAEMPGLYKENQYDLAGFIVGVVDRNKSIDGRAIKPGDRVIGLASNGLHTNGYSLAIKVLLSKSKDLNIINEMMKIHISYLKPIKALMNKVRVKGMAHITGGGLLENIPRVLPRNCSVRINKGSWPILSIFKKIWQRGNVPEADMWRTFNMGIGYVVIVNKRDVKKAINLLKREKQKTYLIGRVIKGNRKVIIV